MARKLRIQTTRLRQAGGGSFWTLISLYDHGLCCFQQATRIEVRRG